MVQSIVRSNGYGIAKRTRFIELESFQTDTDSRDRKDTLHHGLNEYEINGGPAINGSFDVVHATVDGFDEMEVSAPLAWDGRQAVGETVCVRAENRTVIVKAEPRATVPMMISRMPRAKNQPHFFFNSSTPTKARFATVRLLSDVISCPFLIKCPVLSYVRTTHRSARIGGCS